MSDRATRAYYLEKSIGRGIVEETTIPPDIVSIIMEYMAICPKVMPRTTEERGQNRELLKTHILRTLKNIKNNRFLLIIETTMPRDLAKIVNQYVGGERAQLPDFKNLVETNSLWFQEYLQEHEYKKHTRRVVELSYELGHYLNQDDASFVLEYLGDNKDFSISTKENFNRMQLLKENFSRIELVNEMFFIYKGKKYRSKRPYDVIVGYDLDLPLRLVGRSRRARNRRRKKAQKLHMSLSNRDDNPIDYWKYDATPPPPPLIVSYMTYLYKLGIIPADHPVLQKNPRYWIFLENLLRMTKANHPSDSYIVFI